MFAVTTVNVNGVRAAARKGGLDWLRGEFESGRTQVACLQEVRATTGQLEEVLAEHDLLGLHVAHDASLRLGHAGVAVLSSLPFDRVKFGVGPKEFEGTGRWVEVDVESALGPVTVASVYVHAGDVEKPVQQEKYRFLDAMTKWLRKQAKAAAEGGRHFVAAGDLNVAHRPQDLKNWKGNLKNAGFLPEERAYFDKWFDQVGAVDLGRHMAGDVEGPYTWWSMRGKAFDTDTGWRIDYHLVDPALAELCNSYSIERAPSWAERWTDHAPVTATFGGAR